VREFFLGAVMLPTTGTYTLTTAPAAGGTGSANVALFLFANQTATITPGATGSNLAITTPGQEAIYSFSGAAGQLASVQVSNSTFSTSCNTPLAVSILNPDGSTLTSINMCANWFLLGPVTLPATGTYTLTIAPSAGGTGSATVLLWLTDSQTASPTFTPPPGTYSTPQTVSLGAVTPGSTIYYTTDGTTPTLSSMVYSGPFSVAFTQTVQAIAIATPFLTSSVSSGTYSISGPPTVTGLSPASGVVGATVAISGIDFGQLQRSSTVTLNGAAVTPLLWSATGILVKIPQGATTGNLVVTVGALSSAGVNFTVVDPTTGYSRPITISHAMVPNTDQTSFPVLISGTYSFLTTQANGGRVLTSDGSDILFTSDAAGQNLLDFERDNYNSATGQSAFWVRIPTLSHTADTTIYIWYGIPGLTQSQGFAPNVWSNGYAGAWHFGSVTALSTADSTANGNSGTYAGAVPIAGEIGGAASLNGNSQILVPYSPSLQFGTGDFSVSAWVQTASSSSEAVVVGASRCGISESWILETHNNALTFSTFGAGSAGYVSSSPSINDNNWHYLTGVRSGQNVAIYLDGVAANSSSVSAAYDSDTGAGSLAIGGLPPGGTCTSPNWNGSIDEVRISSVARAADWVATEYNNQSSPSSFYSIGQEYSSSGALPTITSVSPNPALETEWITVSGVGFGTNQGSGTLTINGTGISSSTWSDTSITFALPAGTPSGPLIVTNGSLASLGLPFTNNGSSSSAFVSSVCPPLPAGGYMAWAKPTHYETETECTSSGGCNGTTSATLNSSNFSMKWSNPLDNPSWFWGASWTQFETPDIPPNATVQGIYAAAKFAAGGSGAAEIATFNTYDDLNPVFIIQGGTEFYWGDDADQIGACSANLLPSMTVASIPGNSILVGLGQTSLSNFDKSLNGGPVGFAVYYMLPTPPFGSLAVLDPYTLPSIANGGSSFTLDDIVTASSSNTTSPQGLIADGTSTAILSYKTNVIQDVTFTITVNDPDNIHATLASFPNDPNNASSFLTYAPTVCPTNSPDGCTSITVPAASLQIGYDGSYYALALLQAPLATKASIFSVQDTVAAQPSIASSQTAQIGFFPKPVILLHGLWGNGDSFDYLRSYLQQSTVYSQYSWAVYQPPCYSLYLPWDAPSPDTLPGHGDGCELVSSDAILSWIEDVYGQLDNASGGPIIGGRLDIVAHSMGGLGARHFATLQSYNNIRNRSEGSFDSVLTIDTPETGSALADFLVGNADSTNTAPAGDLSNLLWNTECTPTDTVQQCFPNFDMPFAYPGEDPTTGAVASVGTEYQPLQTLNGLPLGIPGIQNIQAGAISAVYPDPSSAGPSLLRTVVDAFIEGIDSTKTATTLLGNYPNDVIVSLGSQLGTDDYSAITRCSNYPLQYLEHSPTSPVISEVSNQLGLGGVPDPNVMVSDTVNTMVMCFLMSGGTSACPTSSGAAISLFNPTIAITRQGPNCTSGEMVRSKAVRNGSPGATDAHSNNAEIGKQIATGKSFRSDERIDVLMPATAALATPVEIPLQIKVPGLVSVSISQSETDRFGVRRAIKESVMSLPIKNHSGAPYVTLVPLRLGRVMLKLYCGYSDGGFAIKEGTLQVGPPSQAPARVIVAKAGSSSQGTPRILLGLTGPGSENSLNIYAVFAGVESPLSVEASYAKFKVMPGDTLPAVSVDEQTGNIHPVHIGEALVETSFAGRKVLTCIAVEKEVDGVHTYPNANCQKLLSPGEVLGQSVEQ
jgi:pimeloyl-ACP methyl ester carboxylesterase